MNKAETIAELDISERTLANYVKNGRLPVSYVKGKTGKIADYSPEDVARLKAELASDARFASPATVVREASSATLVSPAKSERPARKVGHASEASSASSAANTLARVEPSAGQGIDLWAALGDHIAAGLADALHIQNLAAKTLLTFPEAATFTGIPEKRLRDAARTGELPTSKNLGRAQKLRRVDLDRWIDSQF